jgi:hypothetical protein
MRATILTAGLLALTTACASAGEQPGSSGESFPDLREVPREHQANVDPEYWAALERELAAVGQAVRSNPRAEPATAAQDPAAFLEDARRELEETRNAHTP